MRVLVIFFSVLKRKTFCTEINRGKSLAKVGGDREKLKIKMGHFFLTQGLITYQMGRFFIRERKMKVEVARRN